jgi:hypothetical protein
VKPITDPSRVDRYVKLVDEMLVAKGTYERDFDSKWLRDHGWKVVPVKSEYGHFSPDDIERIVPALNAAGYTECLAVATEPLDPLPTCYDVAISKEDFRYFRQECGLLGYLLMDEAPSWAISFYGTYKLFAGPTRMLEPLLGMTISAARIDFWEFARSLDIGLTHARYTEIASRYANT